MRLTQSDYGIDQTTYFRNIVFGDLIWNHIDSKEMTDARIKIVILAEEKGVYTLEISHKSSWESNQNNYTTGLHWGNAVNVIRDHALIHKTLTLFKATGENYDYLIDIR